MFITNIASYYYMYLLMNREDQIRQHDRDTQAYSTPLSTRDLAFVIHLLIFEVLENCRKTMYEVFTFTCLTKWPPNCKKIKIKNVSLNHKTKTSQIIQEQFKLTQGTNPDI